ncbi:homoserine O-acetyltransferase [Neocallimastix lanati (nom. inval.)]|jgi:homoserine O-acetyltransferase|nr:homoserine O-acetyltransferase [Neocallimastix sp. JGI-2020a]
MFLSKPFISKVKGSIQPLSSVTNTIFNNNKCSFTTTTPTKHLSLNNNTTKIPNVNVLLRPKKSPSTLNKKIDKPQKFFTPKTENKMQVIDPSEYTHPFFKLPYEQTIVKIPDFELESGQVLKNPQVAYKTYGKLNETRDNVIVICHALTGSCDVEDWWGPLIGPGKPFDPNIYFIFCGNVLGSPYGSTSPITINPETGRPYGPDFPLTTIRDDVKIHKYILDQLNVKSVEYVVGGSLGGMHAFEWAFFGKEYVHNVVAIATSAYQSAWLIAWNEAQRQCIFCDPNYNNGYYTEDKKPDLGLQNARIQGLMTYRSNISFQKRFDRKIMKVKEVDPKKNNLKSLNALIHNEGNRSLRLDNQKKRKPLPKSQYTKENLILKPYVYSAQSYLRYQADRFVKRFDANCYIALTRKLDSFDISRGRFESVDEALKSIQQNMLVLTIKSDGVFCVEEQEKVVKNVPNSEMHFIKSEDGHDGFLLEFQQVIDYIIGFMKKITPKYPVGQYKLTEDNKPTRTSTFGEVEVEDDEEETEDKSD